MPPLPPDLPMFAPLEDDNRRRAFCIKPGCPDLGDVDGGGEVETSDFLMSLAPGPTAAPKGFGCSTDGLWVDLLGVFAAGVELVDRGLELDENFELKLVIQELRLLKEPDKGVLGSFAVLVGGGVVEVDFSELERVWREGLWIWRCE